MKRFTLILTVIGLVGCSESVTDAPGNGTTGTTTATTITGSGGGGAGGGGGGAGGGGGTTSAGGAGGAGGGTITPIECTDCLATTLTWTYEGGLSQSGSTSAIAPCRAFTYTASQEPDPPTTCTVDIGACDAVKGGVRDIEQALAAPDVVAALASPDDLYGDDQTCVDRPILRLEVGGVLLRIGYDCMEDGSSGCGPGPCNPKTAGIAALERAVLDAQIAAFDVGECKEKFGPP
jgi:hypothetical protein